jgi:hypothetical protein
VQKLATLALLVLVVGASGQGSIKFDHSDRYDTVLTATDSVLFRLTVLEFHRKLALAGYASYFWRDPAVLAQYTDVQADSIRLIGDTARMQVLRDIESEYRLIRDSLILNRIKLRGLRFRSDTLIEAVVQSPLFSGLDEDDAAEVIYDLRLDRRLNQWWVGSNRFGSEELRYRNYLELPDEDAEKLMNDRR